MLRLFAGLHFTWPRVLGGVAYASKTRAEQEVQGIEPRPAVRNPATYLTTVPRCPPANNTLDMPCCNHAVDSEGGCQTKLNSPSKTPGISTFYLSICTIRWQTNKWTLISTFAPIHSGTPAQAHYMGLASEEILLRQRPRTLYHWPRMLGGVAYASKTRAEQEVQGIKPRPAVRNPAS